MRGEQQKQQEEEKQRRESMPSAPQMEESCPLEEEATSVTHHRAKSETVNIPPYLMEQIPEQYREHISPRILVKLQELGDGISEEQVEQIMLEEAIQESESVQNESILPHVNRPSSSNIVVTQSVIPPFVDYVNTFNLAANFEHSPDQDEEQLRYVLSLSLYDQ